MVSCVFPGSFDPVTRGHMDLIRRAAGLFDHVTVTVMVNISKKNAIPLKERIRLLKKACNDLSNVDVDSWDGLLAARANKMLNGSAETIMIPTDPALAGVSSSAVREIASFGGDISAFVPDSLIKDIEALLSKKTIK